MSPGNLRTQPEPQFLSLWIQGLHWGLSPLSGGDLPLTPGLNSPHGFPVPTSPCGPPGPSALALLTSPGPSPPHSGLASMQPHWTISLFLPPLSLCTGCSLCLELPVLTQVLVILQLSLGFQSLQRSPRSSSGHQLCTPWCQTPLLPSRLSQCITIFLWRCDLRLPFH